MHTYIKMSVSNQGCAHKKNVVRTLYSSNLPLSLSLSMYAYMYVCMYVCMYAAICNVHMYVCKTKLLRFMHIYIYIYIYIYTHIPLEEREARRRPTWLLRCMIVCMYVCIHAYINIHAHTLGGEGGAETPNMTASILTGSFQSNGVPRVLVASRDLVLLLVISAQNDE
jgi:hypothetical protein